MSGFSERLAAAKSASARWDDVQVLLDDDLSQRRAWLLDELEDAKAIAELDQRLASVNPEVEKIQQKLDALMEEAEESLVTLRFERMRGDQWAEITARCPVRIEVPIDQHYGYNIHRVARLAAPVCGGRLEGETVVPLEVSKATKDAPAVDEWADLFATISGHEVGLIVDVIFRLNEYDPAQRINDLKKALATRPA